MSDRYLNILDYTKYKQDKWLELEVPPTAIDQVAKNIAIKTKIILELMETSPKTYHRWKKIKRPLTRSNTYLLFRLNDVYQYGLTVFEGDRDLFREWLYSTSIPLGKRKPVDLLKTPMGIEMVNNELQRIEHSDY